MPNYDSLMATFSGLSGRAAVAVAVRAAMRVLPILAGRTVKGQRPFGYWKEGEAAEHSLAVLRCYQVSLLGSSLPNIDAGVKRASDAVATKAGIATNSILNYATHVAAAAAHVAYANVDYAAGHANTYSADSAAAAVAAAAAAASDGALPVLPGSITDYMPDGVSFNYVATADTNLQADVDAVKKIGTIALLAQALWSPYTPIDFTILWGTLQSDFLSLNADFDVWMYWYQARLDGEPLDLELERKWALLPDDILAKSPAEINAHLKFLRSRFPRDAPPEIPESQEPGLQFALQEDGRIDLRPSGFAPPDDVAEILAMRGVIIEALDDLLILLAGSNAYPLIAQVADRYKSAISASELSVDLLYAYGVRLENSRTRLEAEIKSGDCPAMAVPAGEALDSVIALHGPVVYSTARGRELLGRARAFAADGLDVSAYKPTARQVATAVGKAEEAVTELAREAIKQASDEIGEGKHPERSTQIARSALSNFMIAAAKGVQKALTPEVMAETMTKGAYMAATTAAVYAAYTTAPALWAFFITNKALLYDFSMAAGCELSWLPSFLNWLEKLKQRVRLSI